MIYEEYTESMFISRFKDYDRVGTEEENKNFTYKGLRHLFKWLDEVYSGEEFKLDVISICCDFTEYRNLEHYLSDETGLYEQTDSETYEEFKARVEEGLNENHTLILFDEDLDEGFIISN